MKRRSLSFSQSPAIPQPKGQTGLRALQGLIRQKSPLGALEVIHRELGDVFYLPMPGFHPVVLVGPEACRFVMVTDREKFRWRAEGEPVTNLLRRGVLVEDGEAHDRLRRLMNPALHRRMLAGYVESMVQLTDQVCDAWQAAKPHDMLIEMRRIALLILMRTLFKVDFEPELTRLWPAILCTLAYISPGLWLIWRDIPRPGYKKALQQMDSYLYQIIAARRAAVGEADDLLGLLVTTPGMNDDLIRDQLLTMLIAGHDTSTALLAWALYLLGKHPEVMKRVQVEVDAVLGATPPTMEKLNELNYLEQVVKETLRLYPPIHLAMRIAATDLTFEEYSIPAGSRVLFSIYLTQRHPQYWPEPTRFDPERFTLEQNRARPHYTYMPFGDGPRNCIGLAYARVEAKVVLARLFQRFEFELIPAKIYAHMGATLEPRPGVLMRAHQQ